MFRQDMESLDENVSGTCYTDHRESYTSNESRGGESQITYERQHQHQHLQTEHLIKVNKLLIKICKCQRTDDRNGMTCQDNEPLNENVNGTCYTDYGEPQIIDTCGHKKPQHSCDCQVKNVKCSCHTSRGESKIDITCGCKRPQQKYMIRDENCEESKEKYEKNGENDVIRDENCEDSKENCEENGENDVKGNFCGRTYHDGKLVDDHNTYIRVRSKQGNFCPHNDKEASNERNMYIKLHSKKEDSGPGKVYGKTHCERIVS